MGERPGGREIRYRLEAARAYPCESQIGTARADFGSWNALREAQFPPYDPEPGEEPYDPRSTAERVQQTERQLALKERDAESSRNERSLNYLRRQFSALLALLWVVAEVSRETPTVAEERR